MSDSTANLVLNIETGKATQGVSNLASGLEKLGEKTKHGKEELTDFEKSLEHASRTFNEVTESVKKVYEAFEAASEYAKLGAEFEHLQKSVPTDQINALEKATRGTVPTMNLLRFAFQNLNGDLKLTAQGLGVVSSAAKELSERSGKDTIEVMNTLRDSFEKGNYKALREYGIQLVKTGNDQKDLNTFLAEMVKLSNEAKPNPDLDRIEHLQKVTKDWILDMKVGIGDMVSWFIAGIDKISDTLSGTKGKGNRAKELASTAYEYGMQKVSELPGGKTWGASLGGISLSGNPFEDNPQLALAFGVASAQNLAQNTAIDRQAQITSMVLSDAAKLNNYNLPSLFAGNPLYKNHKAPKNKLTFGEQLKYALDQPGNFKFGHQTAAGLAASDPNSFQLQDSTLSTGLTNFDTPWVQDNSWGRIYNQAGSGGDFRVPNGQSSAQYNSSNLSSQLTDQTSALGKGFGTLQSGVAAAVDAAISGSDSIGRAFMKASAAALKSIAIESSVRALYEAAMGFGSLFIPGAQAAAAGHFQAAALFAAAAAAAGVGSAALSALGGGGGAAAGGGGTPSSTGVNQQPVNAPQAQTINVYVSGAITAGSYAELGQTIQKATQLGQQAGRVRTSDSVTVSWE